MGIGVMRHAAVQRVCAAAHSTVWEAAPLAHKKKQKPFQAYRTPRKTQREKPAKPLFSPEGGRLKQFFRFSPFSTKKFLVQVLTIVVSLTYLFVGHGIASSGMSLLQDGNSTRYLDARVVNILSRTEQSYQLTETESVTVVSIAFEAELTDSGQVVTAHQESDPFYPMELQPVQLGDHILVAAEDDGQGGMVYQYHEHVRISALIVLGVLFCLCLLLFGRMKGFNTLLSLGFTVAAIFLVFVPAIMAGQNIYVWTFVTVVYVIAMTLLIVYGAERMSLAAGIGCAAGVAMVAVLTAIMSQVLSLTGVIDEQSLYLRQLNPNNPVDLKAIVFAAIVIGAIGAIMDVSMSISSALQELTRKAPDLSRWSLLRSGLTIGRDMMGTMANTLVLAYIGASLSMTLLLYASNVSLQSLFNREMILAEILQALVGSFGILLTIPLTSLVCSFLYRPKQLPAADVAAAMVGAPEEPDQQAVPQPEEDTEEQQDQPVEEQAAAPDSAPQEEPPQEAGAPSLPTEEESDGPGVTPEEPERKKEMQAAAQQKDEEYRHSFFQNVARIYRELDEDIPTRPDKTSKPKK